MIKWESGKVQPVTSPREQKLNTSQIRSLSPTPVVMCNGPSPFFDPPHTIEETETTSIANCWKLNEKNEESRDKNLQWSRDIKIADDDVMVEHFEILDN